MNHPDILLSRLAGVKPSGDGCWLARCPAHEDRDPSLSIRLNPDGRVLVNCFAGCCADDIMESVGLHTSDLYPEAPGKAYGAPVVLSWSRTTISTPERRAARLERTLRAFRAGSVPASDADDMDVYAMTYVELCLAEMARRKPLDPNSPAMLKLCKEWLIVRGLTKQPEVTL